MTTPIEVSFSPRKRLNALTRNCVLFFCCLGLFLLIPEHAFPQSIYTAATQASVSSTGQPANAGSGSCSLSGDGADLVFSSTATNLSPIALAGIQQIYSRNFFSKTTQLVSAVGQAPGNASSSGASIAASGSFVVFQSAANNLVANDSNGKVDIFVWQRATGVITRANTSTTGTQANQDATAPSISDDGRFVVFLSTATNLLPISDDLVSDVFLKDRQTGELKKITPGNFPSFNGKPAISGNGQFVVFGSYADNLVSNDTNNRGDVFLYNRSNGAIKIIGLPPIGQSFPNSAAPMALGVGSISGDGQYVAFGLDTDLDGYPDQLYLHDQVASITTLLSKNAQGIAGNSSSEFPRLTSDGSQLVFYSSSSNLLSSAPQGGVFHFDRTNNQLELIDDADGHDPCISYDGKVIAFQQKTGTSDQVFQRITDDCPLDDTKLEPGICGCGKSDRDGDLDGIADCNDTCALDPAKTKPGFCGCGFADTDSDGDLSLDCIDACPTDSAKTSLGFCGCGVADTDLDQDSVIDCVGSKVRRPAKPKVTLLRKYIRVSLPKIAKGKIRLILIPSKAKSKPIFYSSTKRNFEISYLPDGKYVLRYAVLTKKDGKEIAYELSQDSRFSVKAKRYAVRGKKPTIKVSKGSKVGTRGSNRGGGDRDL